MNDDYIRVFSYIFLRRYKERTGNDSSGVLFNKFMTLLNRELLSRGVDMHLPHCWYRWGDEVVRYCFPFIDWNHDDLSNTHVRYSDKRPRMSTKDPNVKYASVFADDFISRYAKTYGQEEAIDEVYSDAPFSFQNDFRKLREAVTISRRNIPINNYHDYIKGLFETAVSSFPPEFGFLRQRFQEFEATFRLALDGNAKPEELYEISETFWFFFCYHLRLNSRCHENVPQSTLEVWREVLPAEEEKYRMFVQNQAAEYCNDIGNNEVIDRLLQERNERVKETELLFMKVFG